MRTIVDQLIACGCEQLTWRQWLQRLCSRVSPKLDIASVTADATTCAAQIALASAPTARTAAVLLDQFHGALATSVRAATDAVDAAVWSTADAIVGNLLSHRELGQHLTTPWQVVVAGPPNVGKSSLINAIAGFERAIVSPQPGTTRDIVTVTTAIDGWPVQLADTAGLRASGDAIESAGVELATKAVADADLVVFVEDASAAGDRPYSPTMLAGLSVSRGIHVRNKIDLSITGAARSVSRWPVLATSALTGEGIADLIAAIGNALVPDPPPRGAGVPFMAKHVEALLAAQSAIEGHNSGAAQAALQSLLASPWPLD